ncbi:MAG: Flp pilus assembly protein CpaB, partial [Phycisphaerae bacterium]|nr:Flp pilus assembly protein CpaB [Phycisphaerae bacterium]
MNVKAIIPLAAGLVVGGLALKMGSDALRQARGSQTVKTAEIWAAAIDIPRGHIIKEEALKSVKFPAEAIPSWAFKDKAELIGRVANVTTFADELFHPQAVLPEGAQPGLIVPKGYRAASVRVEQSTGADYHLRPGCHVDVLASSKVRVDGRNETVVRTILENVEVAAVGDRIAGKLEADEETAKSGGSSSAARAVWLFVRPDQDDLLLLAEQEGRLKLTMRNDIEAADDDDDVLVAAPTETQKQLAGAAQGFFASLFAPKPEPDKPVEQPIQEPILAAAPPAPHYEHTMVVFNGHKRTMLAWTKLHSGEQPVEVTGVPVATSDATVAAPAAMTAAPTKQTP